MNTARHAHRIKVDQGVVRYEHPPQNLRSPSEQTRPRAASEQRQIIQLLAQSYSCIGHSASWSHDELTPTINHDGYHASHTMGQSSLLRLACSSFDIRNHLPEATDIYTPVADTDRASYLVWPDLWWNHLYG